MSIDLSPQLESALIDEANRRGTTPEALATHLIQAQLSSTAVKSEPPPARSLYDRWKEHLAEVEKASAEARGPTDLSQDTGRKFAELLQQRREQGRL